MILESNVISLFMRFTTLFTTFLLILFFSLSNNSAFAKRAAIIDPAVEPLPIFEKISVEKIYSEDDSLDSLYAKLVEGAQWK